MVTADRSTDATDAPGTVAAAVLDPEVPVLTIEDLGILRDVAEDDDGRVARDDHPDLLRLPGDGAIRDDIVAALPRAGCDDVARRVRAGAGLDHRLDERRRAGASCWTTASRRRSRASAPARCCCRCRVRCPQCGSPDTRELSRFGSTACKSLWVCNACREPFDHFKAI